MTLLPRLLLLASLSLGSAACASQPAQPNTSANADDGLEKLSDEELARKLLTALRADELGKLVMAGMSEILSKMPNLPPGFMERFQKKAEQRPISELIVPIYLKHYDREMMIAAIRFYSSEQGGKIVEAMPVVAQESMAAGSKWGEQLAQETLSEMGYTTAPPPAPAP